MRRPPGRSAYAWPTLRGVMLTSVKEIVRRQSLLAVPRHRHQSYRGFATRTFDPLRILFCGSDYFSIASLEALHRVSKQSSSFIQSIEVVTRPGKWTGHKRKTFKEVPIADRARSLELPLHQIDTFKGWTPPSSNGSGFNLILAVSFGLLIPRRIIEEAKYGGLNVHPSILPDLWGAAPLQHALLDDDKFFGLTVQTLHPTTMDKGAILAQTSSPGFEVPSQAKQSFSSLVDHVAPLGADLLVSTLEQGLFQSPITDLSQQASNKLEGREPRHARKLVLEDRHIDWKSWSSHKIIHYQKYLGSLWNTIPTTVGDKKLVWTGSFEMADPEERNSAFPPGIAYTSTNDSMLINTHDNAALRIFDCTIARDQQRNIHLVARRLGFMADTEADKTRSFPVPFE